MPGHDGNLYKGRLTTSHGCRLALANQGGPMRAGLAMAEHVQAYLSLRRAFGFHLNIAGQVLQAFARFADREAAGKPFTGGVGPPLGTVIIDREAGHRRAADFDSSAVRPVSPVCRAAYRNPSKSASRAGTVSIHPSCLHRCRSPRSAGGGHRPASTGRTSRTVCPDIFGSAGMYRHAASRAPTTEQG